MRTSSPTRCARGRIDGESGWRMSSGPAGIVSAAAAAVIAAERVTSAFEVAAAACPA